ncbi:MAG: putative Outer rane efflux protein [Nitrospira sp.]|jgi:outer membrane protein TolC|nr:putative Outer rane efflux protein [Nitrospira sp.]
MKKNAWVFVFATCALCWLPGGGVAAEDLVKSRPLPPIPLSLNEVLAWIDRSHPLLKGAGTEKVSARGKMLKALGAFEPVLVNDTEIERFIEKGTTKTQSVGFNDTLVEARHPWGFRGSAGFRQAIGDARIPDLSFGDGNQQVILGGFMPLLKGLMVNPENAELQRSELADPRAEVKISQTRQDLFLAAATQFWDWVSSAKFVDVQRRALGVAEERLRQVEGRAKAGAVAPLDVVEAGQEVQRRREVSIAAQRAVEQEQFKMSMFLWENQAPSAPQLDRAPDFPPPIAPPTADIVKADKLQAKTDRPEIREVDIEAKVNNIDLELAKNNLLPSLDLEAAPARAPEKFVLGLGYRFGVELRMPILQRRSRGEVLEAQAQADRLVLVQKYREQQVVVDVDNAFSAIERAKERVAAASESLRMAKTLEEGERFRFSLGATSVLFVNLRERNSVDSEMQLVRAKADYQKALALYQWATGTWARSQPSAMPVNYRIGAGFSK